MTFRTTTAVPARTALRPAPVPLIFRQAEPTMERLCIITTGGTIDKIYFDDKSDFQIGDPQIGRILSELGVAFAFEVVPLLRKDSLHLDDTDRLRSARYLAEPPCW